MKRFLFCIAMLFCMCMTMNAQGLKTYSGDFSMVAGGFHFQGKPHTPIKMQMTVLVYTRAISALQELSAQMFATTKLLENIITT